MVPTSSELTLRLLQTARRIHNHIAEHLAPLGTTLQQLKVLSLVQEHPDKALTVNAIRDQMMDPMSNVSRLLNKMMDKALIRKVRSSEDQRVVRVELTESGFDLYCRGGDVLSASLKQLDVLDSDQRKALSELLARIEG